jgi:uncharacterized membrane-anchored protein
MSPVLLADLTGLAAELEADAAASLYRFGASRAYDGIVQGAVDGAGRGTDAGPRHMGGVSGEAGGARPCAPAVRSRSARPTCRAS